MKWIKETPAWYRFIIWTLIVILGLVIASMGIQWIYTRTGKSWGIDTLILLSITMGILLDMYILTPVLRYLEDTN